MNTTELTKELMQRTKAPNVDDTVNFKVSELIPSGSTLLNLACTDHANGAYVPGTLANIIGDSSTGKTILALTGLAEMAYDSRFDDYDLIYDDAEWSESFDLEKMFGQGLADRIKYPGTEESPYSVTMDEFSRNVGLALDSDRPCVYILDSLDAIIASEDIEIMDDIKSGKKRKGSYGTQKARQLSQLLKTIKQDVRKTKSVVLIISQTRDKINAGLFEKRTQRSGGKALKFYCYQEIWLAHLSGLTKTVKETKYKIGNESNVYLEKNRVNGKLRNVHMPIYYSYGVDDISSMIDWMVKNKFWSGGGKINSGIFDTMSRKKLIQFVSNDDEAYIHLIEEVQESWNQIEKSLLDTDRRSRY